MGLLKKVQGLFDNLARGIAWVLEDRERWRKLCDRDREKAEREFTLKTQAHSYLKLYQEIINLTRN
jgi:glycosyltransferase involved in cell wall biosynthesis